MEVDVVTDVRIDRPVEVVASYAAEPDNAPAWYVNIKSVDWKTDPPIRTGARVAFVARFMGRRLEYEYEVVEYVPDARLVMRTSQGPFPMETTYTWRANGDGSTVMTLRNRGVPRGFSLILAPFMERAIRKANRADLERLKALLEARQDRS